MTRRAGQLAAKIQVQVAELVEILDGLSEQELYAACPEEGAGATTSAIVLHAAGGYARALAVLRSAEAGPASADMRAVTRAQTHRPLAMAELTEIDIPAVSRWLQACGTELVQLVHGMSDEMLHRVLVGSDHRSAHVGKPISMVIEYMIYQQAGHLESIRRSVDRPSHGRRPEVPARM